MTPEEIQQQATDYTTGLARFFVQHGAALALQPPVDHFAIKAKDSAEFDDWIQALTDHAEHLSYIKRDNRRLATAILHDPLRCPGFGETCYLEIMEPKPDKIGKSAHGFEHIELFTPELDILADKLEKNGIKFERQEHGHHRTLVIVLDDEKYHEVKFTDCPLAQVINQDGDQRVVIK